MSRCIPYPPPGYVKNEALIDAIRSSFKFSGAMKLQKEKEKAKKERRKQKIRDKKEKKSKSREDNRKINEGKHSTKKRKCDKRSMFMFSHQGKDHPKIKEDENEQLEKSGLTEEHGLPGVLYICYSSDSSQNSSKRMKHETTDVNCFGLRIRLPPLKHTDQESPTSTEQPCFSRRIEAKTATSCELPCFSGRIKATPLQEGTVTPQSRSSFFESSSSSFCLEDDPQYRDFVVNWNPSPLQMELPEFDNQEWLLGAAKKQHCEIAVKRCQDEGNCSSRCGALCSWPPRTCYLPEADIHALPFAVPF